MAGMVERKRSPPANPLRVVTPTLRAIFERRFAILSSAYREDDPNIAIFEKILDRLGSLVTHDQETSEGGERPQCGGPAIALSLFVLWLLRSACSVGASAEYGPTCMTCTHSTCPMLGPT
jgi:hypothetical protein